jgi:hypothetical protein
MNRRIDYNDEKAMEMAIELILMRTLNTIRLSDLEDALEMEFDGFCDALDVFESVRKQYKLTKGF